MKQIESAQSITKRKGEKTMRRQIFDLTDVKNEDVIEVLFPSGRRIDGNWCEDHILHAYVNRACNNATFYIQDDRTLWDIELEGFGVIRLSADAMASLYLYVCVAKERYLLLGLRALAGRCGRICDTIDEFLKEKSYC